MQSQKSWHHIHTRYTAEKKSSMFKPRRYSCCRYFITPKYLIMKEQLCLSIPEPCHEDWNKMTPVEQGRHCAVCQKNVVDFTNEADEAIVDFFNNYNGSACGRFTDEQLNRPLSKIELKPASNFLKYAAGLLLPFTFFTSKLHAQKGQVAIKGDTTVAVPNLKTMPGSKLPNQSCDIENTRIIVGGAVSVSSMKKSVKDLVFITGRITDAVDSTPVPGATVSINNKISVVSDSDGYFIIQASKKDKEQIITITSVGYEKAELDISNRKIKNNLIQLSSIHLSKQVVGLSEVVVTGYESQRLGGLTMGISITRYSLADTIGNFFKPDPIKIFPNPVSLNGTIQLNFANTKSCTYQIRLLNASGQLFYSFQKQITSPKETEQIHLNERMSAGVYLLQIIDDKKRLVQTSKIIIQ